MSDCDFAHNKAEHAGLVQSVDLEQQSLGVLRQDQASEPCSSSTRLRFEASIASSAGTTSPEATTRQPAPTADPCTAAGLCAQTTSTASRTSMPPADPSRDSSHESNTGVMLQKQQGPPAGTTSVQLAHVNLQASAPTLPRHVEPEQPAEGDKRFRQSAPPVSDSEDDSWTPDQPQSSAEEQAAQDAAVVTAASGDDSDDDIMAAAAYDDIDDEYDEEAAWDPNLPPPVYCTNCTARMFVGDRCSDCGHSKEQDDELFSCEVSVAASSEVSAAKDCPLIIWDEGMLLHDEGKREPHPERPDRLRAVMAQLNVNGLTGLCQRLPARLATKEELLRVHTPDHLHRLHLFCSGQVPPSAIPSDTYINQHTLQSAALAAGSAAEVAVRVWQGEGPCGAAIIRPPGHHAESNTAMGFCFFNNAAVAARAVQHAGAQRVLILDWDVHHGNGTQHIFERDPSVLYMSLHRYDRGTFYPGTGAVIEVGHGPGQGFTVNIPWDTDGLNDADYMAALQQVLLPIAREFAPDIILISAGFDAAAGDPIGGCNLTPECFGAMTAALMPLAPTVLLLEGGYNLRSTALSTEACLRVLLGEPAPECTSSSPSSSPSPYAWLSIQAAHKIHSRFWSCLAGSLPPLQMRLPAGWGTAAATLKSAAAEGQQDHQGSDDLELQYEDEYEEVEYESDDEAQDAEAPAEGGEEEDGDGDAAVRQVTEVERGMRRMPPLRQQQQQAVAALTEAAADGWHNSSGKRAGQQPAASDAGRRVRFAATDTQDRPHPKQPRSRGGVAGAPCVGGAAPRPLLRNGSSESTSSLDAGRLGGGARIAISRKQLMLKAIHRRAMQLFLRKQRKAMAQQQQQQQQQQLQQHV